MKQTLVLVTLFIAATILLAACGGGTAPTPPPVVVPASTPLPPPTRVEGVSPTRAPATPTTSAVATSMTDQAAIQLRYLDIAMNMQDIASLMSKWQKGNDNARTELGEKLERLDAGMNYKGWPSELKKGMDGMMMSMNAMNAAVKAKDANAGMKNLADMQKAWDDIAHPFYGTWMPTMAKGMKMDDEVSIQATQLAMGMNVANVNELVKAWSKGDDVARVEAGETLERMDALMGYVKWPNELTKGIAGVQTAVKPLGDTVNSKDAAKASQALADVNKAYDGIAHPFYGTWMMGMMKGMKMTSPLSVQAGYLDLAYNAKGLIELVEEWNAGDSGTLEEAGEKVERLEMLFDYVTWPNELTKQVGALKSAVSDTGKALKSKDIAAAGKAAAVLEKTLDELAHDYYKWLK